MSQDYLFELGTEELPPKSLLSLGKSLEASIKKGFETNNLSYDEFELLCSPRRLAFVVKNLADSTPTNKTKVWGPPAKIAFDDEGKPSKAALAFCARNEIPPDQISVESDGKAEKICCLKTEGGEQTPDLMPGFIQNALDALPIAKRMRWGASRTEFVRPIQWLILMNEAGVVPATILGKTSGNLSRGHRFLSNREIQIQSPSSFKEQLRDEGKVIANFDERQALVESQVKEEANNIGGQAVISSDLLEEVTALVEWPVAVSGNFDKAFLNVPAEALVSSMKEHQKYFHVVDKQDNLLPLFITVSNIEATDYSAIKAGNEKVIRPRLADAAFFFETDLKQSLDSRREKLKSVVFQEKLGSIYDKTERIKALSLFIASKLDIEGQAVSRCAELCKSDLVSNMVYEFPEMQGTSGYHYALNDGESSEVAQGIVEHYQPKFAGDELPESDIGGIVGLADRLDTLSGIFGIGQVPTGSKDPFALRRASVSALRIIVEKQYDLDLDELLAFALAQHTSLKDADNTKEKALSYILERFKAWFVEAGIAAEVWQAVSAKALTEPLDINKRVYAVHSFYQSDAAKALAAANKRVANILSKLDEEISSSVNASLFVEDEETQLYEALELIVKEVEPLLKSSAYKEALEVLSGLRDVVDRFFDKVMVMADDLETRANRLALLTQLRSLFLGIADIRFLAPGK